VQRYERRVVAVTGAAQGLGLAMAQRFAAEGATVVLADRSDHALAATGDDLRAGGSSGTTASRTSRTTAGTRSSTSA